MQLIERLEAVSRSDSFFRAALAREDIARLNKVQDMARDQADQTEFLKHALYSGWTKDDMRTHELKETLTPLLEAIYAHVREGGGEDAINAAWAAFDAHRLKVLVHCL